MPEFGIFTITYLLNICTKVVEGTSSSRGVRGFTGKRIIVRRDHQISLESALREANNFRLLNPQLLPDCQFLWQAQPHEL